MFKSQRGSITVFTLTVMLFFVIILMGIFVSSSNARKAQKTADLSLIEHYQKDVNLVNEIYNEKQAQYLKTNYTEVGKIKWQNKDIVKNSDGNFEAKANVEIKNDDIDNCKYIINNTKKYIGTTSNKWEEQSINEITFNDENVISGTITTNVESNKIYFVHVLITYKSGKKIEVISNALNVKEDDITY